jgi:hypothetical protein
MEVLMTEKLAQACREGFTHVRGLPCPSETVWLSAALREAKGEFIWLLAPEDAPRPILPTALLPSFVDEDILCMRSYVREEDDCLPQLPSIFAKNSYRLKGALLVAAARSKNCPLIPTPTCFVFRKSALLEALEDYSGQAATAAEMLRELAQSVYEKGDVGLVPARLAEYGRR